MFHANAQSLIRTRLILLGPLVFIKDTNDIRNYALIAAVGPEETKK